jgi:hypothetical protein
MMNLEREFDLRLQSPVVGRLVETLAILSTGNLVSRPKVRRRDIPNNRAGIRVVEQIADR